MRVMVFGVHVSEEGPSIRAGRTASRLETDPNAERRLLRAQLRSMVLKRYARTRRSVQRDSWTEGQTERQCVSLQTWSG